MSTTGKEFLRQVSFLSTTDSLNLSSGSIIAYGGLSVQKNANFGQNVSINSNLTVGNVMLLGNLYLSSGSLFAGSPFTTIGNSIYFGSGGNNFVGIGQTNPSFQLDVSGNTRISGGTLIIGNQTVSNSVATNVSSVNLSVTNTTSASIVSNVISSGSLSVTNSILLNLTSSNLVATNSTVITLTATNISTGVLSATAQTVSNITSTCISSANIISGAGTFGSLLAGVVSVGNLVSSTSTLGSLFATNVSTSSLSTSVINAGSGTISNFANVNSSSGSLNVTNVTAGVIVASSVSSGTINVTAITAAGLSIPTISTSNLISNFSTLGNVLNNFMTSASINTTGLTANNVLATNLNATFFTATNSIITNGTLQNVSITNMTTSSALLNNATISTLQTTIINSATILATSLTTSSLTTNTVNTTNLNATTQTAQNIFTSNLTTGNITTNNFANLQGNSNTIGSVFTTGGNVGINTTSPTVNLYVNGSTYLNGNVTIGNYLFINNFTTSNVITNNVNYGVSNTYSGSFAAANNVSTPTNVTGLNFVSANVRCFTATLSVSLTSTTGGSYQVFTLEGAQNTAGWSLYQSNVGDTSGVAFSITTAGQIQYTTTNVSNWVSDTFSYSVSQISASGTYTSLLNPTVGSYIINSLKLNTTDIATAGTDTGALYTLGGITVGQNIQVYSTSNASAVGSGGSATILGGMAVSKDLIVGGNLTTGTILSSSITTNNITTTNLASTTATIPNVILSNVTSNNLFLTSGSLTATFTTNTLGSIITNGAKVGINASPGGPLDVLGSSVYGIIRIANTAGSECALGFFPNSTFTQQTGATNGNWYMGTYVGNLSNNFSITRNGGVSVIPFSINSSGNIGVSNVSPSYTLDVAGSARITNTLLATFNSNTVGNIFTTGGNVGINTTAPGYTLDVNGTLRTTNNQYMYNSSSFFQYVNGDTVNPAYQMYSQAHGNILSYWDMYYNGTSNISSNVNGNFSMQKQNSAFNLAYSSGTTAGNVISSMTTAMSFNLTNGVITLPVATSSISTTTGSLVVAGGVGIGGTLNVPGVTSNSLYASNSSGALVIGNDTFAFSSLASTQLFLVGNRANANVTGISFQKSGISVNSFGIDSNNNMTLSLQGTGQNYYFKSNAFDYNNTTGGNFLVTILGSGNVGINTTSPAYTLDVSGSARITGSLTKAPANAVWYGTTSQTAPAYVGAGGLSAIQNNGSYLNTSTGIFTCPYTGLYSCSISFFSNNAAQVLMYLYRNGSNGLGSTIAAFSTNAVASFSVVIACNSGDTLGFYFTGGQVQNGGGGNTQICSIALV